MYGVILNPNINIYHNLENELHSLHLPRLIHKLDFAGKPLELSAVRIFVL